MVARTRDKRCVRAHKGEKTQQPAARNLDCYCLGMPFQEAEGEAPHSLSATCKAQTNAITEEGAATSCRFSVPCVPKQQTGYRWKQTHREKTQETSESQGAKQSGANGRKTEMCGRNLFTDLQENNCPQLRVKRYLAVHSQNGMTRRWLCASSEPRQWFSL